MANPPCVTGISSAYSPHLREPVEMTHHSLAASQTAPAVPHFLHGGGAVGALLRALDWTQHPLGPPEAWPVILQTTVSILLGSRQPMFVSWGPQNHTLYNDGYAQILAQKHPAYLAQPIADMWSDIWPQLIPLFAQVYAGESIHMDHIELQILRKGFLEDAHFSFSYTPLKDDTGRVVGLFCACAETTAQVLLKRDLEHERARLGQIFDQSRSFFAKLDGPDHIFELANPAYLKLVGRKQIIGKSVAEVLPEVKDQGFVDVLDQVYATGNPFRADGASVALQNVSDAPPENRILDFSFQPVLDASGQVTGVLVDGVDVTDRSKAIADLKITEQFLQSVLGASPDCIKVLRLDGRLDYITSGGRLVMQVPDGVDLTGTYWPDLWQDAGRDQTEKAIDRARKGEPSVFQGYSNTFAGTRRYWDVRVTPMLDAAGKPERILAVSRDISYLRQVEEEREHLMRELSHRLKNAFAMVQSVISQTFRQAKTVQEGREILQGRVRALADAQDILTRSIADVMPIAEVVTAALLPHRSGEGQFDISGPEAAINGRQGLGLSLALHELATNAVKYGALGRSEGTVSIRWQVQPDGAFAFCWHESGGPPVVQPDRRGFGSVLIERIVATYFNGAATLAFNPGGVEFSLSGTIAPPDLAPAPDPY
ncbi:MAG: PAS domain-containing protein [Pseudomonadota bacterium]